MCCTVPGSILLLLTTSLLSLARLFFFLQLVGKSDLDSAKKSGKTAKSRLLLNSDDKTVIIFPPDWAMLRRSRCVQIFL